MIDRFNLHLLLIRLRTGALLGVFVASLFPTLVAAKSLEHVVQPGETLLQIALNYDVSLGELMVVNEIANANYVRIGATLLIPSTGVKQEEPVTSIDDSVPESVRSVAISNEQDLSTLTVRPGDTLSMLALNHGISAAELMALNGLTNPNLVRAGQRLYVPSTSSQISSDGAAMSSNLSIIDSYVVQPGDSMSSISLIYNTSISAMMELNGLESITDVPVGEELLIPVTNRILALVDSTYAPPAGNQLIEVNLSQQTLTAWNGSTVLQHTLISSGDAGTPTVEGRFTINTKLDKQDMASLLNVPWVMYFYEGFALHGAYWHDNFGLPMSHGCINIRPHEAKFLYDWADVGTEIFIHW